MCIGIALGLRSPALNSAALDRIRLNQIPLLRKREYRAKARLDVLERFVRQVFGSVDFIEEILCIERREITERDLPNAVLQMVVVNVLVELQGARLLVTLCDFLFNML